MHPELPPVPGSSGIDSSPSVAGRRRIAKMNGDSASAAGRISRGPLNLVTLENGSEPETVAAYPMLQRRRRQQQQNLQNLLMDQDHHHLPAAGEKGGKSRSRGSIG